MSKLQATDQHSATHSSNQWNSIPFEQAIEKITYTNKIQRSEFLADGAYPIVSQEEGLINGYWNQPADVFKTTRPLTVFGDHTQTLKYVDFDFVLGADGVKILQSKSFLLPKFFHYQLQGITLKSLGYARHYRLLKEKQVVYPSQSEQERIVAILDEAFEGIERAQAFTRLNRSNSRALLDGALQSLLERDTQAAHVCLDSVCEISSMLIDPREPLYVDLPHVGAGNIESRTGILKDVQTAREEGLISGKFVFDETMVLYSKIRPYLEKATRPDFRGLCSADMYPLKPFYGKITRDFLFYILLSHSFTQYAIAGSARSGMPKVNRDHLFKYRFKLPSVAEQNRTTEKLDSLKSETERLDGIYKQKQVNLEDLKQSLLQQAFSGNL